jgi:hypothetical protein
VALAGRDEREGDDDLEERRSAARRVRANTTAAGDKSSTAILMKRYGMPQRVETVAKAAHARALMALTLAAGD